MGVVVEVPVWNSSLSFSPGQPAPTRPGRSVRCSHEAGWKPRGTGWSWPSGRFARDPDCIEANLVVAAACTDLDRRLAYLNIAVEAGEQLWNCVDGGVSLSAVQGARPWLQATMALGETLAELGDDEAASECFDRLRALDPVDTLQARVGRLNHEVSYVPGMRS